MNSPKNPVTVAFASPASRAHFDWLKNGKMRSPLSSEQALGIVRQDVVAERLTILLPIPKAKRFALRSREPTKGRHALSGAKSSCMHAPIRPTAGSSDCRPSRTSSRLIARLALR